VPLPEILKAVQAEVPGVTGIAVRQGKAVLTHEAPLTAQQRSKIRRILGDRRRLMDLRPSSAPDLAAADPQALKKVLLDDATPDAEWLRAFRHYAVTTLIPQDSARPDALRRQQKQQ
jgi:hypothetical protein